MQMAAENSLEDYWEDSSVSWGCRGLSFASCLHQKEDVQGEGIVDNNPSYMQDFHIAASSLRPRNFPPPIALCTTLSIKEGGRFVLKEMASLPPHGLRAEREQGRLYLHLIEPQQLDEDVDDHDHDDNCNNFCNLEDPLACVDIHQQEQQDGYDALGTEDINVNHEMAKHDIIQGIPQELVCVGEAFSKGMPEKHVDRGEARTKECNDENKDVESAISEKHAMEHIEVMDNSVGACVPSIVYADVDSKECAARHIEIKNDNIGGSAQMGALGVGQHQRPASLWSKEGSNDIAASFSPCSSKQVLSFARTSPAALGLAVS